MSRVVLGLAVYLLLFSPLMAQSGTPIVTDSRIKTFVYNENDVFTVLTHYGYQSNIEFGKGESVQTVSVGDRIGWQVVPAGRRLFIKAMEEKAHTNMTVVTNKRAYQFDLRASDQEPLHPDEELVYVVRFYYPEDNPGMPIPAIYSDAASAMMPGGGAVAAVPVDPVTAGPATAPAAAGATPVAAADGMNYNYTYTGPAEAAPVKIYDDGRATYFAFSTQMKDPPEIFAITPDGNQLPVRPTYNNKGEAVVAIIAPRFAIRRGDANVMVYNETLSAQVGAAGAQTTM